MKRRGDENVDEYLTGLTELRK